MKTCQEVKINCVGYKICSEGPNGTQNALNLVQTANRHQAGRAAYENKTSEGNKKVNY